MKHTQKMYKEETKKMDTQRRRREWDWARRADDLIT